MPKAIRIHEYGGPEVLRWEEVKIPSPASGEVRIQNKAIGLNYIDTYQRTGLYPLNLPAILGQEAVGIVTEIGAEVSELKVGDRVAYATGGIGAYAEECLYPADKLIPVPSTLSDEVVAASLLKGMTVEYLLLRIGQLKKGDIILFHAIAGGVGLIACQWAKLLGCTVIGTVSSKEKEKLALDKECDYVINYQEENFLDKVMEITDGKGVSVAYDSVGKDTLSGTIGCLRSRGLLVSFGQSSGTIADVPLSVLTPKNLFYIRPSLHAYTASRRELLESSQRLFTLLSSAEIKVEVRQTYPLQEAAQAHRDLESRKTKGSTLLIL